MDPARARGSWQHEYHGPWYCDGMRTTIDAAGRIVVPKVLRDELGLTGGEVLEIAVRDGRLEIEISPTPMRLEQRGEGLVAVPEVELPALTADAVREVLERLRR